MVYGGGEVNDDAKVVKIQGPASVDETDRVLSSGSNQRLQVK